MDCVAVLKTSVGETLVRLANSVESTVELVSAVKEVVVRVAVGNIARTFLDNIKDLTAAELFQMTAIEICYKESD